MSLEEQFEGFQGDPGQDFDIEMVPEQRSAANAAIERVVETIGANPELRQAVRTVLDIVQRTYEPDLLEPKFEMSASERDARDQHTRGILTGLGRAHDYLTNPRFGGELVKLINPQTQED